jgi:hypothetical protein
MKPLSSVLLVCTLVGLIFVSGYSLIQKKEKQVVTLPEDGGAYHLSIFVSDNWRSTREREVVALVDTDSTLASIKAQSHFHLYTQSDPIYKTRFPGFELPCILLQDSSGGVIFKYSGPMLNNRPWLRLRPWLRPRPNPNPAPGPEPNVNVDTLPGPIQDTSLPFPWVLLVITILIAGGTTFLVQFRSR